MTNEQELHLLRIKQEFDLLVDAKYRAGVAEHGGNLWDMDLLKLIDEGMSEAIDQFTYLKTIRDKLLGTYPQL